MGEGGHHSVGLGQLGGGGGIGDGDAGAASGPGGLHTVWGVFDHDAAAGRDADLLGSDQKKLGIRLFAGARI